VEHRKSKVSTYNVLYVGLSIPTKRSIFDCTEENPSSSSFFSLDAIAGALSQQNQSRFASLLSEMNGSEHFSLFLTALLKWKAQNPEIAKRFPFSEMFVSSGKVEAVRLAKEAGFSFISTPNTNLYLFAVISNTASVLQFLRNEKDPSGLWHVTNLLRKSILCQSQQVFQYLWKEGLTEEERLSESVLYLCFDTCLAAVNFHILEFLLQFMSNMLLLVSPEKDDFRKKLLLRASRVTISQLRSILTPLLRKHSLVVVYQ
jgi:hypothetical protein